MSNANGRSIDDIALQWFVTLRDDDVTDAQRRTFSEWRAADPAHEKACAELEQIWGRLDTLAPQHIPVLPNPETLSGLFYTRASQRSPQGWRRVAVAAVVALILGLGWQAIPEGLLADYRTSVGERRVIALDDGSQVELASSSALDVGFSGSQRKVRLVTGEAFFTVAKDPARPFVVEAQDGQVAVLGTAFNIRITSEVAVSVTHNSVEVTAAHHTPVRVKQGQGIHYDSTSVSDTVPVDVDAVQAWRNDQLIFHDARLKDVLAVLKRYRRGYVQLIGRDLGERRVTAVFDARHPDAALESIANSLDLRIFRATSFLIGIASN
jgi:transmembrane sensor